MEINKIKFLRKYIPRLSLSEAKKALTEANWDTLSALKSSITSNELSELRNSILSKTVVSNAAGTGRGMPSSEESAVLEFLMSRQNVTN